MSAAIPIVVKSCTGRRQHTGAPDGDGAARSKAPGGEFVPYLISLDLGNLLLDLALNRDGGRILALASLRARDGEG